MKIVMESKDCVGIDMEGAALGYTVFNNISYIMFLHLGTLADLYMSESTYEQLSTAISESHPGLPGKAEGFGPDSTLFSICPKSIMYQVVKGEHKILTHKPVMYQLIKAGSLAVTTAGPKDLYICNFDPTKFIND